jgi:hypothetical protein
MICFILQNKDDISTITRIIIIIKWPRALAAAKFCRYEITVYNIYVL